MSSADVRRELVDALRLDLVGPTLGLGDPEEVLDESPSVFYRTGFLVPIEADEDQKNDPSCGEEVDTAPQNAAADENSQPDLPAARRAPLPSSLGVSLLVKEGAKELTVTVRWGEYVGEGGNQESGARGQESGGSFEPPQQFLPGAEGARPPQKFLDAGASHQKRLWRRRARTETVPLALPPQTRQAKEESVPKSGGLALVLTVRGVKSDGGDGELPPGTRSVSIFLVNRRIPEPDLKRDESWIFQAELEVTAEASFVPRPNVRNLKDGDWDEKVADLQYADACEFAVGHAISTTAVLDPDCHCRRVLTAWIPEAEVERVNAALIKGVELGMEVLAALADAEAAKASMGNLVSEYRTWIQGQRKHKVPDRPQQRHEVGLELLKLAEMAARRMETGIASLADPQILEAFRLANKAMAAAARQRTAVIEKSSPEKVRPPAWRPFQLAFILMNLPGLASGEHVDREVVDLLFFPTGGGKTEAYLGLAAFTLLLRRLRDPSIGSSGLSVLMRYTLRLLTLDQLSRASTLICALELERQKDVTKLGEWPFEIGLWVGKAATPNYMGQKGDNKEGTARQRTIAFKRGTSSASPIPLENCPWCGQKFGPHSFQLLPNQDHPTDLRVMCITKHCAFGPAQNPGDSSFRGLPILAIDEPIYRRLPCFMIATVDKFAAMPWTGEVGGFFGRVQRYDRHGFYGPCTPGVGRPLPQERLPPPDLIIQDELHLISGPLGTMVGLYESALEELCSTKFDNKVIRPKIVASTATVRRADAQIRGLFARSQVDVFPPPGPDRKDSFFARTESPEESPARLYVGIAAQGRSPKVLMLQTYVILLAAAQRAWERCEKDRKPGEENPADPYMTLLGYFNSLRELGGARRIVEDEVGSRVAAVALRKRVGEAEGSFADRKIAYDVVELTSRVPTDKVSEAKARLAQDFTKKDRVDVAIATNMISVGLDISRLGLMVVYGQPKTSAEYIQATSRVGREVSKPGLVVTILNVHKPRDRSHYERFAAYHDTFYRSVEATSVTPFSPRALDRGLAGTLVALIRQNEPLMTPPLGAGEIVNLRPKLDYAIDCLLRRADVFAAYGKRTQAEIDRIRQRLQSHAAGLLDTWAKIAQELRDKGIPLQYQKEVGGNQARLLYEFLNPELKMLPESRHKFKANRSMRDVEPSVNLWLHTMDGKEVEEDQA